jgi:hypothetical protein
MELPTPTKLPTPTRPTALLNHPNPLLNLLQLKRKKLLLKVKRRLMVKKKTLNPKTRKMKPSRRKVISNIVSRSEYVFSFLVLICNFLLSPSSQTHRVTLKVTSRYTSSSFQSLNSAQKAASKALCVSASFFFQLFLLVCFSRLTLELFLKQPGQASTSRRTPS